MNPGGLACHADSLDSFAACIQRAFQYWGRPVPYDCVAALSGVAFSPSVKTSSPCRAWWCGPGGDVRLEFMGYALGFTAERLPDAPPAPEKWPADCTEHIRSALTGGGVLLCGSWPRWSILTGREHEIGQLTLFGLPALTPPCRAALVGRAYILRPAQRTITRCEAVRDALQFGAGLATGTHERRGYACGAEFYDEWLDLLTNGCMCPECAHSSDFCARRTARTVRSTQLCAASFLARAKHMIPSLRMGRKVDQAAAAYLAMARKLEPWSVASPSGMPTANPDRCAADVEEVRRLHDRAASVLSDVAARL